MPDNTENRGGRDRSRININEEYEVRHLTEKLGVSADDVREAVRAVGDDREKVEEYLRGNRNRGNR